MAAAFAFRHRCWRFLGGDGLVAGIDIDIRKHNRAEIEKHPMFKRIVMLEGSSVDDRIVGQINAMAKDKKSVMVFLDSSHTHEHVLKELRIYSKFVTPGSYIVVFDTIVEFLPAEFNANRPWGVGDNPWTAAREFLKDNKQFVIDRSIQEKILMTAAVDGYLKRVL
jgi:Cephalosporin hydroxylase